MSSLSDADEQGAGLRMLNVSDPTSGAAAQSDSVPCVKVVEDSAVASGSAEKLTDGGTDGMERSELMRTDADLHSPGSVSPVYMARSWEMIGGNGHGDGDSQVQLQDKAGNLLFDRQG